MNTEKAISGDSGDAGVGKLSAINEAIQGGGTYTAVCRDADGSVKWEDTVENLWTTAGKILMLDTFLAGSAYTAASFIGLINATPVPVIADTMASHASWLEVGAANAPAYTAPRKTPSWTAASGTSTVSKATSSVAAFAFTSGGTVGGLFLVLGAGAVSTIDSTAGTLFSAGAFTGGNKVVAPSDTLTVTYTPQIT